MSFSETTFSSKVGCSDYKYLYMYLQDLRDMIAKTPIKEGGMVDQVRKFFEANIDKLAVRGYLRRWYRTKYDTYDGYESDPSDVYSVTDHYWQDYVIPLGLVIRPDTPFEDFTGLEFPDLGPHISLYSYRDEMKKVTYSYKTKKIEVFVDEEEYQSRYDEYVKTLSKFRAGLKPLCDTIMKLGWKYRSKTTNMLEHISSMVWHALNLVESTNPLAYSPARLAVKYHDGEYKRVEKEEWT